MAKRTKPVSALVTGASRGIGRQIAVQLAARGARVGITYQKSMPAAESVLDSLPGQGHAIFQVDMGVPADLDRLWAEALRHFGTVDVIINNAAIYCMHPPLTTDEKAWRAAWKSTLDANLLGPAHLSHLAARAMAAAGGGRIVNISSRGAFRGEPEAPAYGASKAGLNALSQSLAKALAPSNILVFCIAPGWVETDMAAEFLSGPGSAEILAQHPLGRVATAAEVASAVVYCALDAPAAMTGSIIDVNGASYLRT